MITELMLEEEVAIWGYSNLKKKRRRKILKRFGAWRKRVCMLSNKKKPKCGILVTVS